jgi:hypothetical protein
MEMTAELFEYLAQAAAGVESECPPAIDAEWHAWLAHPEAYATYCRTRLGVLIEHVVGPPAPCKAKIHGLCKARIRR